MKTVSVTARFNGERILLDEPLELEPVVGALSRTVERDITLSSNGEQMTIPAGSRVTIHTQTVNMDTAVVGADPEHTLPFRRVTFFNPSAGNPGVTHRWSSRSELE
jgi:cytochrome P450